MTQTTRNIILTVKFCVVVPIGVRRHTKVNLNGTERQARRLVSIEDDDDYERQVKIIINLFGEIYLETKTSRLKSPAWLRPPEAAEVAAYIMLIVIIINVSSSSSSSSFASPCRQVTNKSSLSFSNHRIDHWSEEMMRPTLW